MAKAVPIYKLAETKGSLRESALVLMVRLQEMMDFSDAVQSPENVDELHSLRIAAKRLRYTLELFAPTFDSDKVSPLLNQFTEIQERIGVIHDCDVLFPLILDTLEAETERENRVTKKRKSVSGPPPFLAAEGLAALMTRKRDERNRLYGEFIAFWNALPPKKLTADLSLLIAGVQEEETDAS